MKPEIAVGMRASDALSLGRRYLQNHDIVDPATDARVLLAHAFDISRDRLALHIGDEISPTVAGRYSEALHKRASHAPVSHITGVREFYGRSFAVGPSVLDPRPETELLIDIALELDFGRVLDLGTGSGCILFSLLLERRSANGIGIEKSAPALQLATVNRETLDLSKRAVLRIGDWYQGLAGLPKPDVPGFDLIISNPPYISLAEMPGLEPDVREHEPHMALSDGGDGLGAFREITAGVMPHLLPGGRLIVEIGATQADAVYSLFAGAGLKNIAVWDDLGGKNRAVTGVHAP